MGKTKAIILLSIGGVLLAAALTIVGVNATKEWTVWLIFGEPTMRGGTILLYAAVTGCILWAILRFCVPLGWRGLREARKRERFKSTEQRLADLESGPTPSAGSPEADEPTEE